MQPHRSRSFKLSTDPCFVEKVRDIVGLYLNPPDHAAVLCVDGKSAMRSNDERSGSLFSYVNLEARVCRDHPLRTIREIANAALNDLSNSCDRLFTDFGRPGVAPEKLLRAMRLQAIYEVRSERQLIKRMEFDLLFRWFVGLGGTTALGSLDLLKEQRPAPGREDRDEVP